MDNGKAPTIKWNDEIKALIKEQFVQGFTDEEGIRRYPSLEALAKKHGVGRATVYRHSHKENWQKDKNEFLSELERRNKQARMKEALEHSRRQSLKSGRRTNKSGAGL
jgi:DNA invertase Pin-like site-specific DNA recombinase